MALNQSVTGSRLRGRTVCCLALIFLAISSLITARLTFVRNVKADDNRLFELRTYHVMPGKMQALEARFRDQTSKLLAKHNLRVLGYWEADDASDNAFIFIVTHASREEAKANWAAMAADPEFQEIKKSEQTDKLVDKVDSRFMRPMDFSPMK